MRSNGTAWNRIGALLGAGICLAGLPSLTAAQEAGPPPVSPTGAATASFTLAQTSRLPYPAGAERWVDALGSNAVNVSIPGAGVTVIRKQAVLVFKPVGDRARWEDLEAMYVAAGILAPGAEPKLRLLKMPEGEPARAASTNAFEDRVYRTRVPGEHLALGLIRNLRTRNLLVYGVLLASKLNDAQALLYARSSVETLTEEARVQRMQLPAPAGSVPAAGVIRLHGPQLRQLQQSLVADPGVSPAVKRMAEVVLPQASAVTRSVWRTQGPLSDRAFFDHYTAQARARGWGAPLSRDETQPGRPTLLFQRPYNSGVLLLRAQPTPARPEALLQPSTTIFCFEMEGAINVSALTR